MIPTIKSEVPISKKMKSGLNKKDFIFANQDGKELAKLPGQINGQGFQLDGLTDCVVYLMDHLAQIYIDNCKDCRIFIGPIKGSIMARNVQNCSISVVCEQFRCRDCTE